jgi:hypothetical protein
MQEEASGEGGRAGHGSGGHVKAGGIITVKIKHGSHPSDISIPIRQSETLKALKTRVKTELDCPNKFVRLICGGKLLTPDSASLNKLGIQDGSFIHAVITSQSPVQSSPNLPASQPAAVTSSTPVPLRGFDRLIEIGLTLDEAAALRSSFQQQVDEFAEGHIQRPGEDEHAYRFRIEELWIQNQGPTSEFTLNLPRSSRSTLSGGFSIPSISTLRTFAESSLTSDDLSENGGTLREFVWGVLLGSTLGFLMIFCVWDRNISQRQKLGIMVGISIHMFTGYLQNAANTPHSSAVSSSSLRKGTHSPPPSPNPRPGTGDEESGMDYVDIALELPSDS